MEGTFNFTTNEFVSKASETSMGYEQGLEAGLSYLGDFVYLIPILLAINLFIRNWIKPKFPEDKLLWNGDIVCNGKTLWKGSKWIEPVYLIDTLLMVTTFMAFMLSMWMAVLFYTNGAVINV